MALRGRTILCRAAVSAALLAGPLPVHAAPKHLAPVPPATVALMAARSMAPSAPVLLRAYKQESEIEVWKRAADGRFVHLKTFPICRWSGQLGPKTRSGDRQVPEGFYSVAARQLNPNSAYYLSFDVGYPNAYDRAHGGTGSALMVHGTCSSAGCFAMTDRQVGEIYALVRDALAGGQAAFQFQAFPFRMTARALARHRTDRHIAFWRQLKEGSDRFEATGREPLVGVEGGAYVFAPYPDPAVEALAVARRSEEEARIRALVEGGVEAVRTTYADGGQHPSFTAILKRAQGLGAATGGAAVTGTIGPGRGHRRHRLRARRHCFGEPLRVLHRAGRLRRRQPARGPGAGRPRGGGDPGPPPPGSPDPPDPGRGRLRAGRLHALAGDRDRAVAVLAPAPGGGAVPPHPRGLARAGPAVFPDGEIRGVAALTGDRRHPIPVCRPHHRDGGYPTNTTAPAR